MGSLPISFLLGGIRWVRKGEHCPLSPFSLPGTMDSTFFCLGILGELDGHGFFLSPPPLFFQHPAGKRKSLLNVQVTHLFQKKKKEQHVPQIPNGTEEGRGKVTSWDLFPLPSPHKKTLKGVKTLGTSIPPQVGPMGDKGGRGLCWIRGAPFPPLPLFFSLVGMAAGAGKNLGVFSFSKRGRKFFPSLTGGGKKAVNLLSFSHAGGPINIWGEMKTKVLFPSPFPPSQKKKRRKNNPLLLGREIEIKKKVCIRAKASPPLSSSLPDMI